jgi:hypothetical protein
VCKEFNPAIWDDPRLNLEIPDLALLKERADGRTGDLEGWVPIENIIQAWREKASTDYFDVEVMGSRPSAEGMVNDPEDVDACIVDNLDEYPYRPNAETAGGLDWGFSGMTAWTAFMDYRDLIKVQLVNRNWSQMRSHVIIADIVEDVLAYRITIIHADTSHPFENADLRAAVKKAIDELPEKDQFRCSVIEVPFGRPVMVAVKDKAPDQGQQKKGISKNQGTEKELMLGNYKAYFARRLLRIERECKVAIWQHKRYRYQKNSDKPLKEDDHIPELSHSRRNKANCLRH